MPEPLRWFFDTVVLSNFALVHRIDVLVTRYGKRGHVTQEVLGEISEGVAAGYAPLSYAEEAVTGGRLTAAGPLTSVERQEYRDLLRSLSAGEASCIACAQVRGGTVATDDRAARDGCSRRGVSVTGTIGILKACCAERTLEPVEADAILEAMVREGFYAPVRRVSDLL